MPEKPGMHLYEYATVRYVPCVEREEFVNVGLVMMCKRRRWLRAEIRLDRARIAALFPAADLDLLESQLRSFLLVAEGKAPYTAVLEPHERFRWLTAVRSASITTSRPHPGLSSDLDSTFARLLAELV